MVFVIFLINPLGWYWLDKGNSAVCNNSYVTHGGATKISIHVESLRGISK